MLDMPDVTKKSSVYRNLKKKILNSYFNKKKKLKKNLTSMRILFKFKLI